MNTEPNILTPKEAALLYRVKPFTIIELAKAGKFRACDPKHLPKEKIALVEKVEELYRAQPQNQNYPVKVVREFARHQAAITNLGMCIDHLNNGETDRILPLMQAAMEVGSENGEVLENVVSDLAEAEIDPTQNLLGNRLLERGTFGVIIGHSGVGKSTSRCKWGSSWQQGTPSLG